MIGQRDMAVAEGRVAVLDLSHSEY
jgi:hypothetical protein